MLSVRQRLKRLERSAFFQPPPDPVKQIESRALGEISEEDLKQLKKVARDQEAGLSRVLSPRESAAVAAYMAAWDLIVARDKKAAGVDSGGRRKETFEAQTWTE